MSKKVFSQGALLVGLLLASNLTFAHSVPNYNTMPEVSDSQMYFQVGSAISFNKGKGHDSPQDEVRLLSRKHKNKDSAIISGALGFRVNPNFRYDLNVFYMPNRHLNSQEVYQFISDGEQYTLSYKAKIKTLSTTLNAYYDFAPLSVVGVAPYVTAGAGWAQNKTSNLKIFDNGVNVGHYRGHTSNNLTWKVGAGATFKVADNVFIDLGYRFNDLGTAKVQNYDDYITKTSNTQSIKFKKLYSHQIVMNLGFNL